MKIKSFLLSRVKFQLKPEIASVSQEKMKIDQDQINSPDNNDIKLKSREFSDINMIIDSVENKQSLIYGEDSNPFVIISNLEENILNKNNQEKAENNNDFKIFNDIGITDIKNAFKNIYNSNIKPHGIIEDNNNNANNYNFSSKNVSNLKSIDINIDLNNSENKISNDLKKNDNFDFINPFVEKNKNNFEENKSSLLNNNYKNINIEDNLVKNFRNNEEGKKFIFIEIYILEVQRNNNISTIPPNPNKNTQNKSKR